MKNKKVTIMHGHGEDSIFIKYNKGEKVFVDGRFIIAGESLEENQKRWNKYVDSHIKKCNKELKKEKIKSRIRSIFKNI